MITINNLNKKYGNKYVLKSINITFPRTGLVVIYGPSGCGKTTLLNCISGLLPYEGFIKVNTTNIESLGEKAISDFRLRNYGFVFQDYKLFENESVQENILFPLKSISNLSDERLNRKCKDLMDIVGINILNKQIVKDLSGGEKQRVCIARALVNDPKIILADEPTGALDSHNGEKIMEILSKISKKSLVVVVSHDKELCNKYADEVIELENGEVIKETFNSKENDNNRLLIIKNNVIEKKQSLPFSFLFRHSINGIKQRKWRTLFCNFVTSMGLIGLGLSISLSTSISTSIKKSYASLFKEPSIVFKLDDEEKSIYGKYAGNFYEAQAIKKKYDDYIYDIGIDYICDFESFFPDNNKLALSKEGRYFYLEGISIRNVNEYEWLDVSENTFYPFKPSQLLDDEIVVGLNIDMVNSICFELRIERTVTSLSNYLLENDLHVFFDLANDQWVYSDQQIFNIVAFSLVKNPCIFHTNHFWNQYVFEECMRFPTMDNLVDEPKYPWVMKKVPYFYIKQERDKFLNLILFDNLADDYLFEIADVSYYPWLMLDKDIKDINRILFFSNRIAHIPMRYINYLNEITDNIKDPIFVNNSGFSAYSSLLMTGFSRPMYFSKDENELDSFLEEYSNIEIEGSEEVALPEGILLGHYSKNLKEGVSFKPINGNLMQGRSALDLDEIVLSSAMANKIGIKIGEEISIAYNYDQKILPGNKILNVYKMVKTRVVGIVADNNYNIYHDSSWTVTFFQARIGISIFNLQINQILLPIINNKLQEQTIKEIKSAFPQFEIENPLKDVNDNIDTVCGYITLVLIIFSIISMLISIILLTVSNYLHVLETRKEIALARCIGINKKESKKFVLFYSLIMCFMSFLLSTIELLTISIVTSLDISKIIETEMNFSFNPLSILAMFVLAFAISILSGLFISIRINKFNPIEALNY